MAFKFAFSICVLVPFTCCSTKLILTSKSDGPVNEQTAKICRSLDLPVLTVIMKIFDTVLS